MTKRILTVLVATAAAACGGDDAGPLERAERQLVDLERGVLSLTITARTSGAEETKGRVGYALEGAFDTSTEIPTLDLRYTRMLGDDEHVVEIKCDGREMVVIEDGVTTEVPAGEAASLRTTGDNGNDGPVDGLTLERWIANPSESDGPTIEGRATRTITGAADAVAILEDLSVMAAQIAGQTPEPPLDETAAERIRSVVQESAAEVTVDEDDLPRSVRVSLDFRGQPPPQLADAFGSLAGVTLELDLTISRPNQPVTPPALE